MERTRKMASIASTIAVLIRAELLTQEGVVKFVDAPRFTTLYSEGSPADSVLFLESGLVKLCKPGDDGKELILEIIAPGELFGELALGTEPTRLVDAQVMIESTVYLIPKTIFMSFCDGHAAMWPGLAQLLLQRTRNLQEKIELLCSRDVEYRILHCLAACAPSFGTLSGTGEYAIPLSQAELASLIGATRETTSTALNQLARRGLIRLGRRKIILASLDGATVAAPEASEAAFA
jgi:CRP-like cAMP-binding protein